ncbi:meiosis-specific nuclear structural protein 1-like isoform X2 [Hetaerina americana]
MDFSDELVGNRSESSQQSEYVELKLRQRLREESVELRELESKLRTAYVNKELHAQLAEKEAQKLAQQYREEVAVELMRRKWSEEEEEAKEWERHQAQGKVLYRAELWEQEKREGAEKRRAAYEDFLREKLFIDEVMQHIHEEDQREQEEVMRKKKRTKHEMAEFQRCQEIWKEKERHALEEENRRIIQFLRDKEDFECKIHAAAKKRDEAKAVVTKALMDIIKEQEDKRREREEAHQSLLEEEMRVKEEGEVQLRVREALLRKQEERMAQEWERHRQMERLAKEAREEAEERQELLERMAEADRLEQMSEERRRLRKAEHRRAVGQLLEQRRQLRECQMAAAREEQEKAQGEEEARRLAIEHERLQMLREHAAKLIGFLPKGVLRGDDLPQLGVVAGSSAAGEAPKD